MEYPIDTLDPENFQKLCQALLTREYPGIQCFPVGQPDGGRDAVRFSSDGRTGFALFQVKLKRHGTAGEPAHKWLLETLTKEAPKVAKQASKGATAFFLMTNVAGTGHDDSGSIDRGARLLSQLIPVPSTIWWRDDIMRRIDANKEVKWSFPQLLSGADILHALIETDITEHRDRRSSAIKAFLSAQYKADEEVRFKQIELQNALLDLYIDVPICPPHNEENTTDTPFTVLFNQLNRKATGAALREDHSFGPTSHYRASSFVGSATLLLHPSVQRESPMVVLEGGPGQGKSTVTQYVAQVHRMRLLARKPQLARIPPAHRNSPVRLPVRIDLRDFATWLSGRNPFHMSQSQVEPTGWAPSLEAFLAALVRHHSGGATFDVSDLHAVLRHTETLLLFDGLDEVADIQRRATVATELQRGVERLSDLTSALQVIVTSRPAALANSPGLRSAGYLHLQLGDLPPKLAIDYAERWIAARRLTATQGNEVKSILREKLDEPHLGELARNPMQLAILLSLIHTRGASLPDKRTALYDSYIDLFFNRESEKSEAARKHRSLLIDIHRYLAWYLHSNAERDMSRGSVSRDELRSLTQNFLEREGHDTSIVDDLFTGVIERVGAMVSRIEGTFEFEVQPLREYFAARYLYDTAPYSPPGRECQGTKPDRFDALARDFYWMNVTRFFSGCYSKGELPSLIDRLRELINEAGYADLAYPRMLVAALLKDWVFSQHPGCATTATELLLTPEGLRCMASFTSPATQLLSLPERQGREELVDYCFRALAKNPKSDVASHLSHLIRLNESPERVTERWLACTKASNGARRTRWLNHGNALGVLPRVSDNDLTRLLDDANFDRTRASALIRARSWNVVEGSEELFSLCCKTIIDGLQPFTFWNEPSGRVLDNLGVVTSPALFGFLVFKSTMRAGTLQESLERHGICFSPVSKLQNVPPFSDAKGCVDVTRVAESAIGLPLELWKSELKPWEALTQVLCSCWDNPWVACTLANISAAIQSASEKGSGSAGLLDPDASLCRRARYARFRAGSPTWWREQLRRCRSPEDSMFVVLILLTWVSGGTLRDLFAEVQKHLEELTIENWAKLALTLQESLPFVPTSPRRGIDEANLPARLGTRLAAVCLLRAARPHESKFYDKYLSSYTGKDATILQICGQVCAGRLLTGKTTKVNALLEKLKHAYRFAALDEYGFRTGDIHLREPRLQLNIARTILRTPLEFPLFLTYVAERTLHEHTATRVVPVGVVAERDRWSWG